MLLIVHLQLKKKKKEIKVLYLFQKVSDLFDMQELRGLV